jgi:hypothetical protein
LPHDGNAHHGPIHKTYKDHFQDADFEVDVIPNQGAGAATLRIEAAAASCRAVGLTRKQRKPGLRRSASITSAKMRRATLAWDQSMTGHRTPRMLLD